MLAIPFMYNYKTRPMNCASTSSNPYILKIKYQFQLKKIEKQLFLIRVVHTLFKFNTLKFHNVLMQDGMYIIHYKIEILLYL